MGSELNPKSQAEWDALAAKLGVDLNACRAPSFTRYGLPWLAMAWHFQLALGLQAQWKVTDCYFGGSWEVRDVRLN